MSIDSSINNIYTRVAGKLKNLKRAKTHFCPACNSPVRNFRRIDEIYIREAYEYQFKHSIFQFETFNMFQYHCWNCNSSDRDRLYIIYLKNKLMQMESKIDVIEFAPVAVISQLLKSDPNVNYRSADLLMENVDDKVDLTDMHIYENNRFDFFICSHILEHIEDDIKAMKELYRITKPGGAGIVMVPIHLGLEKSYEGIKTKNDAERWHHYGQYDHVRVYAKKDFMARLQSVGFELDAMSMDRFGLELIEKSGIHPRSVLYIVRKNQETVPSKPKTQKCP